jgi:hypothetical protein
MLRFRPIGAGDQFVPQLLLPLDLHGRLIVAAVPAGGLVRLRRGHCPGMAAVGVLPRDTLPGRSSLQRPGRGFGLQPLVPVVEQIADQTAHHAGGDCSGVTPGGRGDLRRFVKSDPGMCVLSPTGSREARTSGDTSLLSVRTPGGRVPAAVTRASVLAGLTGSQPSARRAPPAARGRRRGHPQIQAVRPRRKQSRSSRRTRGSLATAARVASVL